MSKVVMKRDFHTGRKRQLRSAHRGTDDVADLGQSIENVPADKPGRAGDQNAAHALPRSKANSSQATSARPAVSAATLLVHPGRMTVSIASAPRQRFVANTRVTTFMTVKPRSVARW